LACEAGGAFTDSTTWAAGRISQTYLQIHRSSQISESRAEKGGGRNRSFEGVSFGVRNVCGGVLII
jgi:hypothetical protein